MHEDFKEPGVGIASVILPPRTLLRLKGMLKMVKFLSRVRRNITWEVIRWETVQLFLQGWDLLKYDDAEGDEVPKFKSGSTIVKHLYNVSEWAQRSPESL